MHAPAPVEAEQRRVVADRTIGAATGELPENFCAATPSRRRLRRLDTTRSWLRVA